MLLDANVMYPSRKRDVLLMLYQKGLYRARWTEKIMGEWTERLSENLPENAGKIAILKNHISEKFPECFVTGYDHLADNFTLPDANDHHVLAAAIRCGAQIIVTDNRKDFPPEVLEPLDIEVLSADEFLSETFDLFTFEALETLRDLRNRLSKPSMSPAEFVMDLTAKGMPLLASDLREKLSFL